MYRLGEVLDFLPDRVTKQKRYNNTMLFRMESEIPPTIQIRLKVEINCYEHFNVLGLMQHPFEVENSWFSGKAELTTYNYNELLGTKLRALYQRKKGRDLFDLYTALTQRECNEDEIIVCYKKYMSFVVDNPPTYKQFVHNMELKMQDADFLGDTVNLIRPELTYSSHEAYALVKRKLIDKLQ